MLSFLKSLITGAETVIGIDLGTTNSVVAVLDEAGRPVVIESEGKRITPSAVAFKNGEILVGEPALRQMTLNPHGTLFSHKRFIGRDFSEVKDNGAAWVVPYVVRPGYDGKTASFEVNGSVYDPAQIAAEVLKKLKLAAESYLGKSVSKAVITVPAWFNDRQRQATKDAGRIAGLDVIRVVNEPTAAAIAYAVDTKNSIKKDEVILAFDFGGGTMDATVMKIKDDASFVETLATRGDIGLGGDNFDEIIITDIISRFQEKHAFDLTKSPEAMAKVREAAVKIKIDLSAMQEADIQLPFLAVVNGSPLHLEYSLTRTKFESMIKPLVDKAIKIAVDAVSSAGLKNSQIDKILLVGGSTRVPMVTKKLKETFGQEPMGNRGVDEIVALGAAVFSGIVTDNEKVDIEFEDVTALNLGVKTVGDVFSVIIEANSKIPCEKKDLFTTTVANQSEAEIVILQGMSAKASAADNHILGTIMLENIEPRPAGEPKIEILYSLDGDGILSVSAVDDKGRAVDITLRNASKLDKREIQRMKKESEMPVEDRAELQEARAELSKEIKRIQSAEIKSLPEGKEKSRLIAKVEEAGRVLQESLDADDVAKKAREIAKV